MQLLIVHDISDFIKASVHSLIEHLILGSIFASAIVWIFIRNWRAVLIAAVAIPSSIIATFTLMRGMDFSLNNMTLLALTLAVGIVIDDAIIVLENIFRFMEDKGRDRLQAAIEATQEIGLAVMATTLSLIIIFLPIAFMTGYARKYVNSFRLDDGDGDSGLASGRLHADADDEFPPFEVERKRRRNRTRTDFLHRVETCVIWRCCAGRWHTAA